MSATRVALVAGTPRRSGAVLAAWPPGPHLLAVSGGGLVTPAGILRLGRSRLEAVLVAVGTTYDACYARAVVERHGPGDDPVAFARGHLGRRPEPGASGLAGLFDLDWAGLQPRPVMAVVAGGILYVAAGEFRRDEIELIARCDAGGRTQVDGAGTLHTADGLAISLQCDDGGRGMAAALSGRPAA